MVSKLERLVRMGVAVLAIGLSSCLAKYKTISPDLISPVRQGAKRIERQIDSGELRGQEVIDCIQTPEQAQDYLNEHPIKGEKNRCYKYAVRIAKQLSDNGYPPLILMMGRGEKWHAVFLYRTEKGFGALGDTPMDPIYDAVNDLVKDIQYKHGVKEFDKLFVTNLKKTFGKEWRNDEILVLYYTESEIKVK